MHVVTLSVIPLFLLGKTYSVVARWLSKSLFAGEARQGMPQPFQQQQQQQQQQNTWRWIGLTKRKHTAIYCSQAAVWSPQALL